MIVVDEANKLQESDLDPGQRGELRIHNAVPGDLPPDLGPLLLGGDVVVVGEAVDEAEEDAGASVLQHRGCGDGLFAEVFHQAEMGVGL